MKNFLIILIAFAALLAIWEGVSHFNTDLVFVIPAPSQVVYRLIENFDRFMFHTGITIKEMLVGFLLAFLMAFPLAWVMDLFYSARVILQPLFIVIQCIPMFTLAPIMVMWFGWSLTAIVVPTALMIFFPLTINIYQGLRATPSHLIDYFNIHQATPWQIFFKLKLPWALPHIFAGFRLSAAIAGIAAVAGEWAGAQAGLGILMLESRRDTDLETTFGALICLTFVSAILYTITLSCEYFASARRPFLTLIKQAKRYVNMTVPALLIGSCIAAGLGGCHSRESNRQVRLTLDWLPNANHIPLYVGIQKRFFENQGIQLVIQKLQDPSHATTYLMSGQCELAVSYMPHVVRIQQKGAPIIPIGLLVQEPLNALIYREGEGIENIQDLTGKRIGYANGGKDTLFLDAMLAHQNIVPLSKHYVGFDLVSSLGTRQVDALYGAYWNIETEHLRSLGINTQFFKFEQFDIPSYDELIIVAKEETPQVEYVFIQHFQKALQQSIDYAKSHPEEAFNIYKSFQPDKSVKTLAWEKEAWKMTLPALAQKQQISIEKWERFRQWLEEHHLL